MSWCSSTSDTKISAPHFQKMFASFLWLLPPFLWLWHCKRGICGIIYAWLICLGCDVKLLQVLQAVLNLASKIYGWRRDWILRAQLLP